MTKVKLSQVIRRCQTRVDRYDTDLLYCVAGEHFESGEIDLAGRGEIAGSTIGPMFYYGFKPGDFLLVSRNPHLKKASRVDFAGICSEKTFVLETADENVLSSEYLPWVLQNDRFWDYAQKNRHGSTNFFINWSTLADYEFELPPVEEQKRIAAILWAAQSVRRNYHKLLKACDDIVKSQFVEMFGDPGSSSKSFETQRVKEAVAAISDGPFGSNLKSSHYVHHGIRVLRLGNIKSGHFDNSDEAYITEEHYKTLRRYTCHPGDVLVGTLGEPNLRACIIPEYIPVSINKSDCVHISLNPNKLTAQYVCTYFNLRSTLLLAMKNMHGNTRSRITMSQVANLPMPVPPLELQQEFADFATSVDKSKFK